MTNKKFFTIYFLILIVLVMIFAIIVAANWVDEEMIIDAAKNGDCLIYTSRLTKEEAFAKVDTIIHDPSTYWLEMRYQTSNILGLTRLKLFKNEQSKKKGIFDQKASEILNQILTEDMDEYNKVLAIHDWICENVTYKESEDFSDQSIVGVFENKEARCSGYAKAFSYLLDKAGIKSQVINGYVGNVPHAWNVVWIDNTPYYFDITWDDDFSVCGYVHDWFAIDKETFEKDHKPNAHYKWEDAIDSNNSYYKKFEMNLDKYSAKELARIINEQKHCDVIHVLCSDESFERTLRALSDTNDLSEIFKYVDLHGNVTTTYGQHSTCIHITIS